MKKKIAAATVYFRGVRAERTTPDPEFMAFGGHTSCLEITSGKERIFCGAGSALENLCPTERPFPLLSTESLSRGETGVLSLLKDLGSTAWGDITWAPLLHASEVIGYLIDHDGLRIGCIERKLPHPEDLTAALIEQLSTCVLLVVPATRTDGSSVRTNLNWPTYSETLRFCEQVHCPQIILWGHAPYHTDMDLTEIEQSVQRRYQALRPHGRIELARERSHIPLLRKTHSPPP